MALAGAGDNGTEDARLALWRTASTFRFSPDVRQSVGPGSCATRRPVPVPPLQLTWDNDYGRGAAPVVAPPSGLIRHRGCLSLPPSYHGWWGLVP